MQRSITSSGFMPFRQIPPLSGPQEPDRPLPCCERLCGSEKIPEKLPPRGEPVSLRQLRPDRRAGQDRLILRQQLQRLGEIAANFFCGRDAEFVGKARSPVRLMDNGGNVAMSGGGTAGHVTPNLALIPSLRDLGYEIRFILNEHLKKSTPKPYGT